MSTYTLTKHEKDLVDNYIIKVVDAGSANHFSVALFNNALCNILPTWRTETLINSNSKRSLAYIDYVKDLYRNNH